MGPAGSYYIRDAGVAVLRIGAGSSATTEEKKWGLIDYDGQGQVACVEIWRAANVLPADLLAALPSPDAVTMDWPELAP